MTPRPPLFGYAFMHDSLATEVPTRLGRMGDAPDKVVERRRLLACWHATSVNDAYDTAITWAARVTLEDLCGSNPEGS